MDDPLVMSRLQGQGELAHQDGHPSGGERPSAVDVPGQRPPPDVRHGQVRDPVDLTHIVHRAEVGMTKDRRGMGLAVESAQHPLIGRPVSVARSDVGDFQGHLTMELRITNQVDGSHRPLAQQLEDAVPAESPGQSGRSLGVAGQREGPVLRDAGHLAELTQHGVGR